MSISTIGRGLVVAPNEVEQITQAVKELPEQSPLREFIAGLLDAVSRGVGVSLVEQDKELSPNDVASLLQVSRPHVMKMIHTGELPASLTGTHYRVMYSDFRNFADRRDRASKRVAEVIANAGQHTVPALSDEELEQLRQL